MTVLRMNTTDIHASPRLWNESAQSRRRAGFAVPASPQIQSWARGMEVRAVRHRSVIAEKRHPLPVFSSEGIRWDVLMVALSLILLLLIGILVSDVSALYAGDDRISRLSTGIASLERSNSILRDEISRTQFVPAKTRNAESEESERIVIPSPEPKPTP